MFQYSSKLPFWYNTKPLSHTVTDSQFKVSTQGHWFPVQSQHTGSLIPSSKSAHKITDSQFKVSTQGHWFPVQSQHTQSLILSSKSAQIYSTSLWYGEAPVNDVRHMKGFITLQSLLLNLPYIFIVTVHSLNSFIMNYLQTQTSKEAHFIT